MKGLVRTVVVIGWRTALGASVPAQLPRSAGRRVLLLLAVGFGALLGALLAGEAARADGGQPHTPLGALVTPVSTAPPAASPVRATPPPTTPVRATPVRGATAAVRRVAAPVARPVTQPLRDATAAPVAGIVDTVDRVVAAVPAVRVPQAAPLVPRLAQRDPLIGPATQPGPRTLNGPAAMVGQPLAAEVSGPAGRVGVSTGTLAMLGGAPSAGAAGTAPGSLPGRPAAPTVPGLSLRPASAGNGGATGYDQFDARLQHWSSVAVRAGGFPVPLTGPATSRALGPAAPVG